MDDVMEEEHDLLGLDLGDQPCFYPLGELVNGDKQVCVALMHLLEGPNQIEPLDHEWPRDGDHLECLGWQIGLPRVVLAPFASAHHVHGIGHDGWPVEALPKYVFNESSWCGVVSTCPTMDILQLLSPLLGRDAALQDLGVTLFVKFSLNDGEGLSAACELSSLHLIH
jgi:hypothetical protein